MATHLRRQLRRHGFTLLALAVLLVSLLVAAGPNGRALATSGGDDPYSIPVVKDTNPGPNVVETTLIADEATVDIGNGVTAHAQTFNGEIPGPTFYLKVGDTVIVHYENHLSRPSAVHWHGIELEGSMDGTPFTQNPVTPGGSFLYKFKVSRPGIFWYHPHHHAATNQVFKGLYGMIIVTDRNEAPLQAAGTLPSAADTKQIVLSDMTVCKAPGHNDAATYDPSLPWVGGGPLPAQPGPTPLTLCETSPIDENGAPRGPFAAGDIPNIQTAATVGRTNEGQTVLTNGLNAGGRAGSPSAPGALAAGASTLDVRAGQGLRLQILDAAQTRYMRLRLTTSTGRQVPLVRVGGEGGGLLDNAVVEGGVIGGFDTQYGFGEILLPPGSRADVVAAIPASATGVLTLWTEDYNRTGLGFADIPTVPVMHLNVTGRAGSRYTIGAGTPLRAATGDLVPVVGPATGRLLDPTTFAPPKLGLASQDIRLTQSLTGLSINDVFGTDESPGDYTLAPHLGSSRYAKLGDTLELTATNVTAGGRHPFHLHGFSIQPISLTKPGSPSYIWPYHEFRDNVDIPPGYSLTFRVKLTDRPLADGVTMGGGYGRWLFHCHIFFHHTNGMLSELVVVAPNGNEKPDVNANATSLVAHQRETATMHGTYHDPDGDRVRLTASIGKVTDDGGGQWTWTYTTGDADPSRFVYITATDSQRLKDQAVFVLNSGNCSGDDRECGDHSHR
jgi:FtsP/CotA-like multicopper oxidase with cupredoxin domain